MRGNTNCPDDMPNGLWGQLQSAVLRSIIGRIALAVVLAQTVIGLIRETAWYLLMPIVANLLHHQSDSVLFERYRDMPIRWDYLFDSFLQFALAVVLVIFVNRSLRTRPSTPDVEADVSEEPAPEEQICEPGGHAVEHLA